jgi:uncharacterized protein YjbI with pentapeptide repeats
MHAIRETVSVIITDKKWQRIIALFAMLLFVSSFSWVVFRGIGEDGYWARWLGFAEYTAPNGEYYPAKTLWDLLDLIIVPVILAIGAVLFNRSQKYYELRIAKDQKETELKIADDRQKEQALQNYLDKMTDLLLKDRLLEKKDTQEDPVVDVAQIRTITTLRSLDVERKNILLQFLRDSGLGQFILCNASLKGADLCNTNLFEFNLANTSFYRARLNGADLCGANLRGADLGRAVLTGADLTGADLTGAILNKADLSETDLCAAILTGAHLSRANLFEAKLWEANLSQADLIRANLSSAILNGADLQGAYMKRANLNRANLNAANLSGANLIEAYLRDANLTQANLDQAILIKATVTDAQLSEAFSLEGATMPDGTKRKG